jgi:O-antigen/teichoic acid export membrane protein
LFVIDHPELRPRATDVDRRTASILLRTGSAFFVIALTSAISYQMDAILISHFLGVGAVTSFAVPARLFSLIPLGFTLVVAPLWPAHAESLGRADHAWADTAPPPLLLLTLASWAAVSSIGVPLSMFLYGAHVIRAPVIIAMAVAVANPALSILLIRQVGIAGPVLASVVSQCLLVLGPALLIVAPFLRARTSADAERWLARWSSHRHGGD